MHHSFQIVIPRFLPTVAYFLPFQRSQTILLANHIQYKKRSSLTRSKVAENVMLTIPVKRGHKKAIFEKEIAYIENWDRKHLTHLYHNFHMYPFFDEYFHRLETIYSKQHHYLIDFLVDQLELFTEQLKIDCTLKGASQEGFAGALEEDLIRYSHDNSKATFMYNHKDVESGFIRLEELNRANVTVKALATKYISSFKQLNILEFLFRYGPEAAFKLREG